MGHWEGEKSPKIDPAERLGVFWRRASRTVKLRGGLSFREKKEKHTLSNERRVLARENYYSGNFKTRTKCCAYMWCTQLK